MVAWLVGTAQGNGNAQSLNVTFTVVKETKLLDMDQMEEQRPGSVLCPRRKRKGLLQRDHCCPLVTKRQDAVCWPCACYFFI